MHGLGNMENIAKIEAININKKYNGQIVLEDISFVINKGEFVSILGSSGCGKTTLLKIIMGIEKPDTGSILKDGENITLKKPSDRKMGMVFQNYALFPNMNVYQNVAYALRSRHIPKEEIKSIVEEVLKIVGLFDYKDKKPSKLSGGQQQRVAIARTLALRPEIILFDEPMAALDADIRMTLRKEIKSIQERFNKTIIYVTHDQEEAFSMSDRIIVMNDNHIAQYDTPKNIYKHPANDFVKSFVVNHLDEKAEAILKSTK